MNNKEEQGEHAFAVCTGTLFYVCKTEPVHNLESTGAIIHTVVGYEDGNTLPMLDLKGKWGGKWWWRTGPNRT